MEEWRNIPDYPNYWVSNLGRVKSIRYIAKYGCNKETLLKQYVDRYGYMFVGFSINRHKVKWFKVHRLVAMMFLDDYSESKQVNHKDENKKNNNIFNLEMCDNRYNCNYGSRKTALAKTVIQEDLNGNFIREWCSTKEVERVLGYSSTSVSACCKGFLKDSHSGKIYPVHQAYGYKWKYK